jgi:hypothetical protein
LQVTLAAVHARALCASTPQIAECTRLAARDRCRVELKGDHSPEQKARSVEKSAVLGLHGRLPPGAIIAACWSDGDFDLNQCDRTGKRPGLARTERKCIQVDMRTTCGSVHDLGA